MKIGLTSDIHLEFGDLILKNEDNIDVLVLSGDIMIAQDMHDHPESTHLQTGAMLETLGARQKKAVMFREFLSRASFQFPHVVYVAGNHEFYHGKWPLGVDYLRHEVSKFPNIHFLEMDTVKIDDVTFVGGTLWTDMNKGDALTLHCVADMMNDFKIIVNSDKNFARLKPSDVAIQHRKTLQYIKTIVQEKHNEKFVVVGHHAPTKLSVKPRYQNDTLMNGAYSSDLTEFILDHPQIKVWTHGHTHDVFDYMIGTTRVVCNPRGYVGYERGPQEEDPYTYKIIEV